jgi:hypothetical protein
LPVASVVQLVNFFDAVVSDVEYMSKLQRMSTTGLKAKHTRNFMMPDMKFGVLLPQNKGSRFFQNLVPIYETA